MYFCAPLNSIGINNNLKYSKDTDEEFSINSNLVSNIKSFKEEENVFKMIRESFITVILFHAHWCGHCKHFLPVLKEISNLEILNKIEFYEVECSSELKYICEEFDITKYPTLKVYLHGKELDFEPSRDKNALIELLIKLIDNRFIDISNLEDLVFFNENYGDLSYILYSNADKVINFIENNNYEYFIY